MPRHQQYSLPIPEKVASLFDSKVVQLRNPLKVICLISGGKDSIYSMLHVINQGHQIVALGNLYPAKAAASVDENDDPESHMYQTAGHTLIPLLGKCLRFPLYRNQIQGTAVSTGADFKKPKHPEGAEVRDELADLGRLLRKIKNAHPEANAVSTGAILSTYQRTRIELVASKLGLLPLAYLWQYTSVWPDRPEDALLTDMELMKMEARIVKVASGGLTEKDLWTNVASLEGRTKINKLVSRFGEGEGAVIGEGGEYETFVVDGPPQLFKDRLYIQEKDRVVVRGESGTASLAFKPSIPKIIPKHDEELEAIEADRAMGEKCDFARRFLQKQLPVPELIGPPFRNFIEPCRQFFAGRRPSAIPSDVIDRAIKQQETMWRNVIVNTFPKIDAEYSRFPDTISIVGTDMAHALGQLNNELFLHNPVQPTRHVVSVTLLLRDMGQFEQANKAYVAYFRRQNPPSRVCIAVGNAMPDGSDVILHCNLSAFKQGTLHIQSRSYWAPANIGPYSQAKSVPLSKASKARYVAIAGQIPLNPATQQIVTAFGVCRTPKKLVPDAKDIVHEDAITLTAGVALALQHVWRIATERDVSFFIGATCASRIMGSTEESQNLARCAGKMWRELHKAPTEESDEDDDEDGDGPVDLWEMRNRRGEESYGVKKAKKTIPNWNVLNVDRSCHLLPSPYWYIEVLGLPMNAPVEWIPGLGITGGDIRVLPRLSLMKQVIRGNLPRHAGMTRVLVDGQFLFTTIIQNKIREEEEDDMSRYNQAHAMIGAAWADSLHDLYEHKYFELDQLPQDVQDFAFNKVTTDEDGNEVRVPGMPDINHPMSCAKLISLAQDRIEKHYVDYADYLSKPVVEVYGKGMVNLIPCRTIYDDYGNQLTSVCVLRDVIYPKGTTAAEREAMERNHLAEGRIEEEDEGPEYDPLESLTDEQLEARARLEEELERVKLMNRRRESNIPGLAGLGLGSSPHS